MDREYRLLIINLGGTSSKVAVCCNSRIVFTSNIRHEKDPIFCNFADIWDQHDFRKEAILKEISDKGEELKNFDAIVSRGTPVKAMNSGCYAINQAMLDDARSRKYGNHPTGVGVQIAFDFARELGVPALTVDAPCIDEFISESRYTGWKGVERKSFYQALNQKAVGRRLAEKLGKKYAEINAIIVHMGGGMSIAAHERGRVIDVNNGLDGDGPMAPERAGTLPIGEVLKAAYSGKYTYQEIYNRVNGRGGLFDHLRTKDGKEVEKMISEGDGEAKRVYNAMIYQIAKSVGAASVTLKGHVDAIAFTGGLAYSDYLISHISEWCGFIAPVHLFPGENEIESLAEGATLALLGEWSVQQYI